MHDPADFRSPSSLDAVTELVERLEKISKPPTPAVSTADTMVMMEFLYRLEAAALSVAWSTMAVSELSDTDIPQLMGRARQVSNFFRQQLGLPVNAGKLDLDPRVM